MDLRKLTENCEQFLERQKTGGSEGGDIGRGEECWVPCRVGRFSYVPSSQNFPPSIDVFPPATVGQGTGAPVQLLRAVASHQSKGRGCPGGGHKCHPFDIHFPHCPLYSGGRGIATQGGSSQKEQRRRDQSIGCFSERQDEGAVVQPHPERERTEENRPACRVSGTRRERSQTQQAGEAE